MTKINLPELKRIILPVAHRRAIIEHCRRKLEGCYLSGEEHNRKAYGLLAGDKDNGILTVKDCRPLLKNARSIEPHRSFMDEMMQKHAIESETPLDKRGWVADPAELIQAITDFKANGLSLIGTYHMHRVAWDHDRDRDTPTVLDTVLGLESRLIMVIVSMVVPDRPTIRAFYEGRDDHEIPISSPDE